jgi:hypothetical protein
MGSPTLSKIFLAGLMASAAAPAVLGQSSSSPEIPLAVVKMAGIDKLEQQPNVDWQAYREFMLDPVTVDFSTSWDVRAYGRFGLEDRDVEELRGELAAITRSAFTEALSGAGYASTSKPGAGVLQIEARIVDLYVNAPPRRDIQPRHTYIFESGEMTLEITLRDSVTGVPLARLRDRYRDPGIGALTLANDVTRQADSRRVLADWARQLQKLLAGIPPSR